LVQSKRDLLLGEFALLHGELSFVECRRNSLVQRCPENWGEIKDGQTPTPQESF
jgi:hypothetical protein